MVQDLRILGACTRDGGQDRTGQETVGGWESDDVGSRRALTEEEKGWEGRAVIRETEDWVRIRDRSSPRGWEGYVRRYVASCMQWW